MNDRRTRRKSGGAGSDVASGDYEVGYGKPPMHTRWPKDHCPNPKGRPTKAGKRARTVAEILDRLLTSKVTIRDGNSTQTVPRLEYLIMRAIDKAGKGDLASLKFVIEMRERFPLVVPEAEEAKEVDADDLAIIEDYLKRMKDEGEGEP